MPQLLRRGSLPIFTRLIQVFDDSTACRRFVRIRLQRRLNACFVLLAMLLGSAAHGVTISSFTPASGPVGTTVTINGSGYNALAGTYVKFNGAGKVSATVISAYQLTVVVPSNASTGVITVTVGYSGSATSQTPFTVTTGPTITSFSPTSGAVGTVVTIVGSAFAATPTGNNVTFNGTSAAVGSNSTATTLYATVPNGASSGPIVVTVSGLSTTSANSFTVLAPPNVPESVSVPASSSTTSVTVSWIPGGGSTATYYVLQRTSSTSGTWSTNVTATSYTDTVPGNGTYSYQIAACNTVGCSAYTSPSSVQVQIPAPTCASEAPVASSVPSTAATQRIYAFGVQNATSVLFPTWWIAGNKADLLPLQGTNAGNGTWYADVPLGQFDATPTPIPRFGAFETDVYLSNSTDTNVWCGGGSWTRDLPSQLASGTSYYYDFDRRLTFINSGISTDQYEYDPLGNLQDIVNIPYTSIGVVIREFYPIQGGPGTTLYIHGGVFAANGIGGTNTVTFAGGAVGTVVSSTYTDLAVTVPSGAQTGNFTVANFYGSATSALPFTALSSPADTQGAQPQITGFSPSNGSPPFNGSQGTSVTVTGSNFNPVPGQTVVSLGSTQAAVTSISDTQIIFTVPAGQGTANIYVTTPFGTAMSSATLAVPVSTTTAIGSSVPLTLGATTAQQLTLSNGACGAYTFSGAAGSWISLQLSALTAGATANWMLYGPNNRPVTNLADASFNNKLTATTVCGEPGLNAVTGNVSSSGNMSVHLPPLPSTGSYTLVFDPGSSTSVSLSATLTADPVVAAGTTISAVIPVAGQSERVQFAGVLGEFFIIDFANEGTSPSGSSLTVSALSPEAVPVNTFVRNVPTGTTVDLISGAEQSGTYGGAIISAGSGVTGSAQISADLSIAGNVVLDGPSVAFSESTPGKALRFTTTLSSGQMAALAATQINTTASALTAEIFDPSGKQITGSFNCPISSGTGSCSSALGYNADLTGLSLTGTYSIVLLPASNAAYSGALTLSTNPVVALSPNVSTAVNLSRPGQTEYLTFAGSSNQPELINVLGLSEPSGDSMFAGDQQLHAGSWLNFNSAVNQGMLFLVIPPSTYFMPLTSASSGSLAYVLDGIGTAATGSATVILDQKATSLAVSQYAVSTYIANASAGRGVLATFDFPSSDLGLNLNLTMSNGTGGMVTFTVFSPSGNPVWMQQTGSPTNITYNGTCAATASNCTYTLDTSNNGNGTYTVVFSPGAFAPTTPPGFNTNLPNTEAASFTSYVNLMVVP